MFVPAKLVPDPRETPDPIRPVSTGTGEIKFAAGITGAFDVTTVKAGVAPWRKDPYSQRCQGAA